MYENELTYPISPFVKLVHKKRSQMKASLGVSEKGCTPKVEVSMTVARVRSWHGCNTLETKCQQSRSRNTVTKIHYDENPSIECALDLILINL